MAFTPYAICHVRSSQNQPLKYLENRLTYIHQILHGHWHRHTLAAIPDMMSEVVTKKNVKSNTACDDFRCISRERFHCSTCLTRNRQILQGHPPCRYILKTRRIWRHQVLPAGSYRRSKNGRKCRIRQLWVEFLQNSLTEDHGISRTYRGQLASQTCRIWRH